MRRRGPSVRGPSAQTKTPNVTFRFRSLVFIECGLEADELVSLSMYLSLRGMFPNREVLQSGMVQLVSKTTIPNSHRIQTAVRDGLGITSPNDQQLFEVDRNGSLPDMNHFLRARLPQLFHHFAKVNPWVTTINNSEWEDGDRLWPYVLLARSGRTLVPAILNGRIDPTISDFRDNSGRVGCPDGDRIVFLGEIPYLT